MTTLVDCPESRIGDWNFRIFGIPVLVKIWFWVAVLLIGGEQEVRALAIWIAVCLGSILIHELGHVCAIRAFRERAEIVLYGWGGMTIPDHRVSGSFRRVVIALAGPLAGFCVTAATLLAARYSGDSIRLGFHMFLPVLSVVPRVAGDSLWQVLLNDLLWLNFYWGLVNLLPIYPLDGGHAAQAILDQVDPRDGRRKAFILSAALAAAVVIFGVLDKNSYMVLVFAILGVSSLQLLDGPHGHIPLRQPRTPR